MIFKRLITDSAVYGIGDLIFKLIGFFTFPFVASYLNPRGFGTLEFVGTISGMLGLLINCGLNNSVQRFYWDAETQPEDKKKIVSNGLFLQLCFGFLFFILASNLIYFKSDMLNNFGINLPIYSLVCALFAAASMQLVQYGQDVVRLYFQPSRFLFISFLNKVLVLSITLIVIIVFKKGVAEILIYQTVTYIVLLPIVFLLIRKDIIFKFDKKWALKLLNYGYPFIFTSIAFYLFSAMDTWMIAKYSSLEEVGIYSVSFKFTTLVLFISNAFGQGWSPHAVKIKAEHPEKYKVFYADILSMLFFIMLIIGGGLSLFSGEIIGFVMSPIYAKSALPLSVLTFGIIFQTTTQVTAVGISLEKKTFLFTRVAWVACGVNFVLNLVLIPRFGALGSAWATLVAYIVLTSGYFYYTQRLHPLPVNWKLLSKLFILGMFILMISIFTNSPSFVPNLILIKLVVSAFCIMIVWNDIPFKEI